jgi:uncharacterized protein
MELTNTFTVSQPVERAWAVITDLERVAPCLPGAALLGVTDDGGYRGAVKIKVGPVTAQYEGIARFVERDDEKHHAVLRAEGRDVRGQGNAAATIALRLHPQGEGTEVVVETDLELAGRVAQFGRGVIADVSGKLIGQFARRLEEEMGRTEPAAQPSTGGVAATPRSIDDVEPLDLMATGGGAIRALLGAQALPIAAALLGLLIGWLLGRRGHGSGGPAAPVVLQLVLPRETTNLHDPEGTR